MTTISVPNKNINTCSFSSFFFIGVSNIHASFSLHLGITSPESQSVFATCSLSFPSFALMVLVIPHTGMYYNLLFQICSLSSSTVPHSVSSMKAGYCLANLLSTSWKFVRWKNLWSHAFFFFTFYLKGRVLGRCHMHMCAQTQEWARGWDVAHLLVHSPQQLWLGWA